MAPSLLLTDGYKFSMAEAGWPLRTETFHYVHRKGGAQVVPFDIESELRALLPSAASGDYDFLDANEYEMGVGFKTAIAQHDRLRVRALPEGAMFFPGEPVFTVTGPSALVSWMEPLVLQLHYRFQIAALGLRDPEALAAAVATVTCNEQRELVERTLVSLGVRPPAMKVDSDGYRNRVREKVRELKTVVGDLSRVFEVGLRSASCPRQHELALEACREEGITRTSNAEGARKFGMVPVGTMGHEHVMRYGSDLEAFRAIKERRPYRSSFLLDTYDTLISGIPAAFQLMKESPEAGDSIRYDSGDKLSQYFYAVARAKELGLRPVHILEDAFNTELTRKFEEMRVMVGWGPNEQFYGYGGHLVAETAGSPLTRDRVAAVYKLSMTAGEPTMKFAHASGKRSIPGCPVVWRRRHVSGPVGIIGQEGEEPPEGYFVLTGSMPERPSLVNADALEREHVLTLSPQTQKIADTLYRRHFPNGDLHAS
ncbi:MAG: nicotinate phosphoribosyltransferase [Myxococcaceae bacterium]